MRQMEQDEYDYLHEDDPSAYDRWLHRRLANCPSCSQDWGLFQQSVMNKKQTYRTSKKAGAFEIDGHQVIDCVVDDLDDQALQDSFRIYLEKEDYEYCQALCIEADRRGFKLWE